MHPYITRITSHVHACCSAHRTQRYSLKVTMVTSWQKYSAPVYCYSNKSGINPIRTSQVARSCSLLWKLSVWGHTSALPINNTRTVNSLYYYLSGNKERRPLPPRGATQAAVHQARTDMQVRITAPSPSTHQDLSYAVLRN